MGFQLEDAVRDTTTSTGTGNITLAGAPPTGYRSFASAYVVTSDSFPYAIRGQTGSEIEIGFGYLSASTTLVRQRVQYSSNANALVNFSAGTKDVYVPGPADMFNVAMAMKFAQLYGMK